MTFWQTFTRPRWASFDRKFPHSSESFVEKTCPQTQLKTQSLWLWKAMTPAFTPDRWLLSSVRSPVQPCGSVSVFWWSWLWRSYLSCQAWCLNTSFRWNAESRKPLSRSLPRRHSRRPRFLRSRRRSGPSGANKLRMSWRNCWKSRVSWMPWKWRPGGKQTMTPRWRLHPSVMSITGRKILSSP